MEDQYRQHLRVPFQYTVHFTRDVFSPDNTTLAKALGPGKMRWMAFVDDGLMAEWPSLPGDIGRWSARHANRLERVGAVQHVPGGERIKNDWSILDRVGRLVTQARMCRHSVVLIVGGGAVLDAVGFAAAVVHRGLRQVRVPTTVLSQADSGVGVKNGVNRFGIKNLYGTFAPPHAVVNDAEFLRTLSDRDWIGGVAEAFKVGILKDRPFLHRLAASARALRGRDLNAMEAVVRHCATLHLDHIREGGDPFETGSARPLDFGHWAAHRLEAMTDYAMRHGEAVAIGVALDLWAATELGLLPEADAEWVCTAMERCGLRLWDEALDRRTPTGEPLVLEGIEQFREHLGGRLTLTMPDGLGAATQIHALPEDLVARSIDALRSRAATRREGAAAAR